MYSEVIIFHHVPDSIGTCKKAETSVSFVELRRNSSEVSVRSLQKCSALHNQSDCKCTCIIESSHPQLTIYLQYQAMCRQHTNPMRKKLQWKGHPSHNDTYNPTSLRIKSQAKTGNQFKKNIKLLSPS